MSESLYNGEEAKIMSEGGQLRWFGVERGLDRVTFVTNVVQPIQWGMMEELEGGRMGVKIDDKRYGALLCADDIVLLADTGVELQDMLDVVWCRITWSDGR